MPTTPIQALPYPPAVGATPDVPRDVKALAEAVENRVVMRFASIAERDAKLPAGSLLDGMMCHIASEDAVYLRSGGQWRLWWQDTGWVTSGLAVTGNANFTVTAYSMRRSGNHVKGRIAVTFTGGSLSSDAAGDFANVALPTIPADWAPTGFSAPITMERVGAAVSFGWAETTGQLRLISSSLQSAVVLATGASYVIYLDHFTG